MEQDTWFRVRGTQALRCLVFSNSLVHMGMWDMSTRELSKAFSNDVQDWLAVGTEELIYSTDQLLSPLADISVAVGMRAEYMDHLNYVFFPTLAINEPMYTGEDFVGEPINPTGCMFSPHHLHGITTKASEHVPPSKSDSLVSPSSDWQDGGGGEHQHTGSSYPCDLTTIFAQMSPVTGNDDQRRLTL
ncbi:hypothetical protein ARMSODRAFT_981236 [Armillaria solidipes]|uniref:Uncharacterized protein n=1 Tax=Armillaria solidipes TaxID=1076256 RepID=A0A2H3B481_9AGAR|nr:hypothetical protein ARMSODRAFT_981236 [Armillaria solidipes]